jgi:hypothetical protein
MAGTTSMPGSSDEILEKVRTREVTGVFHSRKALIAAAEELLLAGFDRADIDVSASFDELQRRLNYASIPPPELADVPIAPRQPLVDESDVLTTDAVVGSVAGCAGALAMAFYLVIRGWPPLSIGILSILAGLIVGGLAVFAARRRLERDRIEGLERLAEEHGLLIWVRVNSPEKEAKAQEILVRHGAEAVHVHEIELAKRPDDLPLHSLRPDPWLGDERLGQP